MRSRRWNVQDRSLTIFQGHLLSSLQTQEAPEGGEAEAQMAQLFGTQVLVVMRPPAERGLTNSTVSPGSIHKAEVGDRGVAWV